MIGELFMSLSAQRKAAPNWEKKWQVVLFGNTSEIGTWSSASVCRRAREFRGLVHGDDFIQAFFFAFGVG